MENLWASWRRDFILGPKEEGCVFCGRIRRNNDRDDLILHRGKFNFVIMNKYPYNSGHLMVIPNEHRGALDEFESSEYNEFFNLTREAVAIIKEAIPADGFNIGMNIGPDAGAGVKDHVHMHIVPRFRGDTNFMSVISDSKVQSISMFEIYDMLKPGFDRLQAVS